VKGERKYKEKGPKSKPKVQKTKRGSQRGKWNKLCSRASTNCKKHIRKGKGRELENVVSLEEPSPTTMMRLKIKVACALYKATDTLCL
jgi:hypothetical protein